jgi:methionyl-tRNA formyltransferase
MPTCTANPSNIDQRIVLITGNDLEHRYVANVLSSSLRLTGIVIDHGKRLGVIPAGRRLWRRYTLTQLASRVCLTLLKKVWLDDSRRPARIMQVLGAEYCGDFIRPEILRHVEGINSPHATSTIESFRPDILLIYGTGIVGQNVLSLARRIALNMHTGISPYYRGCDCAFWPVHNEELHLLGATVHECTNNVDGGRIFGTTKAALRADDCLFAIFARCVKAGTDLYVRTVQELLVSSSEGGAPQDLGLGKEYKAFMRNIRVEWKTRRKVKRGLVRRYVEDLANASAGSL